jgi:hypothetical protein
MIINYKTLGFLLVSAVTNSLSAQTAEFDAESSFLVVSLLKIGSDACKLFRLQHDSNPDTKS